MPRRCLSGRRLGGSEHVVPGSPACHDRLDRVVRVVDRVAHVGGRASHEVVELSAPGREFGEGGAGECLGDGAEVGGCVGGHVGAAAPAEGLGDVADPDWP